MLFKAPAGTSRGVLLDKPSWYLIAKESAESATHRTVGIGECGPIPGLSRDDLSLIEDELTAICNSAQELSTLDISQYDSFPSIQFGLESLRLDIREDEDGILYPSDFTKGEASIPINGLIWMGDPEFMSNQIRAKLDGGYRCLKMKIGSLDFETECDILQNLRAQFNSDDLEIRVDANGAFTPQEAPAKLEKLARYALHSIEQPIAPGQLDSMATLCQNTPLPIALDEELIFANPAKKKSLLNAIKPHYIILKPSLLGGFAQSAEWIAAAESVQAGWWITSALESNIGLNAIAQWTATLDSAMPQGLGTGQIYTNNIPSPLYLEGDQLSYDSQKKWNYNMLAESLADQKG